MTQAVERVRHYKAGYEVRHIRVSGDEAGGGPAFTVVAAFTSAGHYIGNSQFAHRLVVRRGIVPQLANPEHKVCSIGFCEREQKWYGWSHRAISGFGVGDSVHAGDCTASSGWTEEYLVLHPEENLALPIDFTARTLADAKRMAIAFAASVS